MQNVSQTSVPAAASTTLSASKKLVLAAALLSLAMSVWLFFSGDQTRGLYVGLWVPSILSLGNLILKD
jgi:hypothetical protein